MRSKFLPYLLIVVLWGCYRTDKAVLNDGFPPITPDYIDIAIPVNIAPLNFYMGENAEKVSVTIMGNTNTMKITGDEKVQFPLKKWKRFLVAEQGNSVRVMVKALQKGQWIEYKEFQWDIKPDSLDSYLSYRLIEPGYEVWKKIQMVERNTESFRERVLADNNLTGDACMNCHIYGNQNGNLSMMHIRGSHGGTMLNRNGILRKINTRSEGMVANAIYGNIHPTGRFAVFSSNIVIPEIHAYRSERLEVYDSASDLVVIDFDTNEVLSQPFLSDSIAYETFPVFSACGKWIYYCSAPFVPLPDSIKSLKYNICRVSFDAQNRIVGSRVDTLWNAREHGGSVSHLKTSPNGKYLLYTVADYGTFPIWHREANLQMMHLPTGQIDDLNVVNDRNSDSYHSWSSNSRWFVFASKRDNGIYGKPYFCYVDSTGRAHKPFVLPQSDPAKYDQMLKSFNIPELSKTKVPFNAIGIERMYWNAESEKVTLIH